MNSNYDEPMYSTDLYDIMGVEFSLSDLEERLREGLEDGSFSKTDVECATFYKKSIVDLDINIDVDISISEIVTEL